jgi:hypothetical protein
MARRLSRGAHGGCIRELMRSDISRRRFLVSAAGAFSAVAAPHIVRAESAAQPPPRQATTDEHTVAEPVSIEVNARSISSFDPRDHSHLRFGALQYRSGLVLTSSYRGFGGLSAIRMLDGRGERFIALSDKGTWFTGRVVYSGREMTGLADVEAAPILGPDGRPAAARGWYDPESIALDGDSAYVGIERVNQVLRFDFSRGFTRARGEVVALPLAARKLPYNKGLEALVFVPKGKPLAGTLIAIAERGLDAQGNLLGFLIGGPTPGQFSIRRSNNFDISDAVLLASGDLLVLERKFSWLSGVGIRIRRIALNSIAPGALVDGPSIFDADLGHEIDNMEGIDAHVSEDGDTVLTMVSDDNFSLLQRTLILQFSLAE